MAHKIQIKDNAIIQENVNKLASCLMRHEGIMQIIEENAMNRHHAWEAIFAQLPKDVCRESVKITDAELIYETNTALKLMRKE